MKARTTVTFRGTNRISGRYSDEKPIGFYVIEIGDEDRIISCSYSYTNNVDLLNSFITLLHDIEAIIDTLSKSILNKHGNKDQAREHSASFHGSMLTGGVSLHAGMMTEKTYYNK